MGHQAKKRVAAYARVSTDSKEQLASYKAQVGYYTRHIKSNPEWEFVFVYTDEAISATNTKKRKGFNQMITDALSGKIDLVITKSISRFARNTVDTLTAVRKLKEKGVEVYFEKENIHTLDAKGELLITIMSSLAQEESRSISENVTWGQRKRMADGKVNMAYKRFLGYEKGKDGTPSVVEAEANIVRRIYALFLEGKTYRNIAGILTAEGIPTPGGNKVWRVSTVKSILSNEKYAGNAILQKRFTVDFLTKTTKVNEGEVPQYFVKNSHPAIITLETFELAQSEIQRRAALGKHLSGSGLFFGKIVCGECGGFYGSKIWHSNDKYRRLVWQCNAKYKNSTHCATPHLTEDVIQNAFVSVVNRIIANKGRYIAEYAASARELTDESELDKEDLELQAQCAETLSRIQDCVSDNARRPQDQAKYQQKYDALTAQYEDLKERLDGVREKKHAHIAKAEALRRFIAILRQTNAPLACFDESLWSATVESVTVFAEDKLSFAFKSGTVIEIDTKPCA